MEDKEISISCPSELCRKILFKKIYMPKGNIITRCPHCNRDIQVKSKRETKYFTFLLIILIIVANIFFTYYISDFFAKGLIKSYLVETNDPK